MKWACITRFYDDDRVSAKVARVPDNTISRTHQVRACEEVITVCKTKQEALYLASEAQEDTEAQDRQQWDELTNN